MFHKSSLNEVVKQSIQLKLKILGLIWWIVNSYSRKSIIFNELHDSYWLL